MTPRPSWPGTRYAASRPRRRGSRPPPWSPGCGTAGWELSWARCALLDGDLADDLTADELRAAEELAGTLPALVASVEACGLPDTVVHGDFHSANWRSHGLRAAVVDFADSHLGHPFLDGLRPRGLLPGAVWAHARDCWVETWTRLVPGCEPARALVLAAPLYRFAYAVRYQEFLDGIEHSERIYHLGDPAAVVRKALVALTPRSRTAG